MDEAVFQTKKSTTVRSQKPRGEPWARALQRRGLELFPRLGAALLARRFLTPASKRVAPLNLSDASEVLTVPCGPELVRAGVWGAGPLVILVHGWSGGASQFDAARRVLIERGYRVVTFDAPAHGGAPGRRANVGQFASVIDHLALRLGPVHALVGHSLGGASVALAAGRGVAPRGLVLLAPLPSFDFALDEFRAALGFSPAIRERLARRVEAITGLSRRQVRLDFTPFDRVPTLLVHDTRDRSIGADHSRSLATHHPDIEYLETRGLGHRRVLKDAAVLDGIGRFLDGLPRARPSALEQALAGW